MLLLDGVVVVVRSGDEFIEKCPIRRQYDTEGRFILLESLYTSEDCRRDSSGHIDQSDTIDQYGRCYRVAAACARAKPPPIDNAAWRRHVGCGVTSAYRLIDLLSAPHLYRRAARRVNQDYAFSLNH